MEYNKLEKKLEREELKDNISKLSPLYCKLFYPVLFEEWITKEYYMFYEVYNQRQEEWRKI